MKQTSGRFFIQVLLLASASYANAVGLPMNCSVSGQAAIGVVTTTQNSWGRVQVLSVHVSDPIERKKCEARGLSCDFDIPILVRSETGLVESLERRETTELPNSRFKQEIDGPNVDAYYYERSGKIKIEVELDSSARRIRNIVLRQKRYESPIDAILPFHMNYVYCRAI